MSESALWVFGVKHYTVILKLISVRDEFMTETKPNLLPIIGGAAVLVAGGVGAYFFLSNQGFCLLALRLEL